MGPVHCIQCMMHRFVVKLAISMTCRVTASPGQGPETAGSTHRTPMMHSHTVCSAAHSVRRPYHPLMALPHPLMALPRGSCCCCHWPCYCIRHRGGNSFVWHNCGAVAAAVTGPDVALLSDNSCSNPSLWHNHCGAGWQSQLLIVAGSLLLPVGTACKGLSQEQHLDETWYWQQPCEDAADALSTFRNHVLHTTATAAKA